MKQFSIFKSQFSNQRGFTLIELLIVFSIIGILTSLGLAAYSTYNESQTVQSSATDVATILNTAKEQALSQVIPATCGTNTVTGYQVDVTIGGQAYTLSVVCGSKQIVKTANLPPQLMFTNGSASSVLYTIATGTVANPATISITGYGKTKMISINQTGSVAVN